MLRGTVLPTITPEEVMSLPVGVPRAARAFVDDGAALGEQAGALYEVEARARRLSPNHLNLGDQP